MNLGVEHPTMVLQPHQVLERRETTPTQQTIKKNMSKSRVHPSFTKPMVFRGPVGHIIGATLLACLERRAAVGQTNPPLRAPLASLGTDQHQLSQLQEQMAILAWAESPDATEQVSGAVASSISELPAELCQHRSPPGVCPVPSAATEEPELVLGNAPGIIKPFPRGWRCGLSSWCIARP